jgi:biopolymer transport protein ExbD
MSYANDRDTEVVIRTDHATQHGVVIELLERGKAIGLTHFSLLTQ